MSEEIRWAFLRSFVWPHEFYTLRAYLESNDIMVFMRDEMTIQVDPLLSNAMGGIKMYVPEDKLEAAIKLVDSFYDNSQVVPTDDKED